MKTLPRWVAAAAVFGLALFAVPLVGLLLRVPWSEMGSVIGSVSARAALRASMVASVAAVAVAFGVGLPIAVLLARMNGRIRRLGRLIVAVPIVMPPVVGGVALLSVFGRNAPLGRALATVGVRLSFTLAGTIVAVSFVSVPLFILTAESGIRALGTRLEGVASTLGARPWRVLYSVTVPGARGALLAGAALTFTRALGEFGATITFAGNLSGRTQTLPLAVYEALQVDPAGALVLSAALIGVAVVTLVMLGERVRR